MAKGKINLSMGPDMIDGRPVIFHVKMDIQALGLTEEGASLQDLAEEYAVVAAKANAGIMIYGKYNGQWQLNPWSTKFLIRSLLELLGYEVPAIDS